MKTLFLTLTLLCNILTAHDFQSVLTPDGSTWSIYLDRDSDNQPYHIVRIEKSDESDEVIDSISFHNQGVEVSCPNLDCDSEGRVLAVWIEETCVFSRCVGSYFNGEEWGEKKIISPNTMSVDPFSSPALSLDGEHDATIAYTALDVDDICHLLINHLDDKTWSPYETVVSSQSILTAPALSLDLFGNNFIAWIDQKEEVVNVAQQMSCRWVPLFQAPALDFHPPMISQSDEYVLVAWFTDELTVQTAQISEEWVLFEPITLTEPADVMVLSYTPELGHYLLWAFSEEENTHFEIAFLEGSKWLQIKIDDILNDDFNP